MTLSATSRGASSDKTAATSQDLSPSSNFTAGKLAVLVFAYDNAGTSGADPFSSISDSIGNTWASQVDVTRTAGSAANDGVSIRIFTSRQTVGQITTGTTITVSFGSTSVTACAWALWEVSGSAGRPVGRFANSATGSGTAFTMTTSTINNTELLVCGHGVEQAGSGADDTDTTNGSWSTGQAANTTGGTTTNIGVRSQYKIQTTTGSTQTWNFTTSNSDWAGVWITFYEAAEPVNVTPTITRDNPGGTVSTTTTATVTPTTTIDTPSTTVGGGATEISTPITIETASATGNAVANASEVVLSTTSNQIGGSVDNPVTDRLVSITINQATAESGGTNGTANPTVVTNTATTDNASATGSGSGTATAVTPTINIETPSGNTTGQIVEWILNTFSNQPSGSIDINSVANTATITTESPNTNVSGGATAVVANVTLNVIDGTVSGLISDKLITITIPDASASSDANGTANAVANVSNITVNQIAGSIVSDAINQILTTVIENITASVAGELVETPALITVPVPQGSIISTASENVVNVTQGVIQGSISIPANIVQLIVTVDPISVPVIPTAVGVSFAIIVQPDEIVVAKNISKSIGIDSSSKAIEL